MTQTQPKFFNSPFFVMEQDNWHLKPGAPESVRKEFDEYMRPSNEFTIEPVAKSFSDVVKSRGMSK